MPQWPIRVKLIAGLSLVVLVVRPRSSVWISWALLLTRRMACIASVVARIWLTSARAKLRSSQRCGYQCPYNALNRAVVNGSLIGV